MDLDRKQILEALGKEVAARRCLEKKYNLLVGEMDCLMRRKVLRDEEIRKLKKQVNSFLKRPSAASVDSVGEIRQMKKKIEEKQWQVCLEPTDVDDESVKA